MFIRPGILLRAGSCCALLLVTLTATAGSLQFGPLQHVSYGAPGVLGNQGNRDAGIASSAVSADGRYIVFSSGSDNLAPDDRNDASDVFLYDHVLRSVHLISALPDGSSGNGDSFDAAISADGRWIAFASHATDLPGTGPGQRGIYLHDIESGETRPLLDPASYAGYQASKPSLSADGSRIAFYSYDLPPTDGAVGRANAFLLDRNEESLKVINRYPDGRVLGGVEFGVVTLSTDGRQVAFQSTTIFGDSSTYGGIVVRDVDANTLDHLTAPGGGALGISFDARLSLSSDGRFLAFSTNAALQPIDTNQSDDVYVFDRTTRAIELVSVSTAGAISHGRSNHASISGDGRYVAFLSDTGGFHPAADGPLPHVYRRDRLQARTELMSRPLAPAPEAWTDYTGYWPDCDLSADGRVVVYASNLPTLVKDDSNRKRDVFRVEADTGTVNRTVASAAPLAAGSDSYFPDEPAAFVAAGGRAVVFNTLADNVASVPQGTVYRHHVATGHTDSLFDSQGLPTPDHPTFARVDAISDDARVAVIHHIGVPPLGLIGTPPERPRLDLWLAVDGGHTQLDTLTGLGAHRGPFLAALDGTGRRVAMLNYRTSPAPGPLFGVFTYDTDTNLVRRIDVGPNGELADGPTRHTLGLSRNGRFVAFLSEAGNLVADSIGARPDLYLFDTETSALTRVVHPQTGVALYTSDAYGSIGISDDGNVLAFASRRPGLAPTLVSGTGVFRLDRAAGVLRHVSASNGGAPDRSFAVSMSRDGRLLAFVSGNAFAVSDVNDRYDVYLFDASTATLSYASTDAQGTAGTDDSYAPHLASDGRSLVFLSASDNWQTNSPPVFGDIDVFLRQLIEPTLFQDGFE